ncbi:hypothetical protein AQ882_02945, partial [Burkholderia pseudomallei]
PDRRARRSSTRGGRRPPPRLSPAPGAPGGAAMRARALGHRGSGRRRARRFAPRRGGRVLAHLRGYIIAPFLDGS